MGKVKGGFHNRNTSILYTQELSKDSLRIKERRTHGNETINGAKLLIDLLHGFEHQLRVRYVTFVRLTPI